MLKAILAASVYLMLAPLLVACALVQSETKLALPGGSDRGFSGPSSKGIKIERRKKATTFTDLDTGEQFDAVSIERRKKATTFKDESPERGQRDGKGVLRGKAPKLSGEDGPSAARQGDPKRRGRAATLLSGSEGIRDKLGRSGKPGFGKSLG